MPKEPSILDKIGTDLVSLNYEFSDRIGQLHMPEGFCCDMDTCIELFKRIDPKVVLIATFADATADTVYRIIRGKWTAS